MRKENTGSANRPRRARPRDRNRRFLGPAVPSARSLTENAAPHTFSAMAVRHGALGHVVFNVASLSKSERFYRSILGMKISARNRRTKMTFLSFGREHHDVALQQLPRGVKHGGAGGASKLHHFCIYVNSE